MAKIYDASSLPSLQNSVLEMLDTFGMTSQNQMNLNEHQNQNQNINSQTFHVSSYEPSFPSTSSDASFKILFTFQPHLSEPLAAHSYEEPIDISLFPNQLMTAYRHLFVKLAEKSNAINTSMEEYAALWADQGIEWSHPGLPSSDPIWTFGRLCSDADQGKWNETSILLETTRGLGSGARVRCFLEHLSAFSFFPGQLVAMTGVPLLDGLHLTSVLCAPSLERPLLRTADLFLKEKEKEALCMVVAVGPFSLLEKKRLDYGPLDRLLKYCEEQNVHVLILMGPFMDLEQWSQIEEVGSDSDGNFVSLFKLHIASRLNGLAIKRPNMRICLVPSLRDGLSLSLGASVLPQPALQEWKQQGAREKRDGLGLENGLGLSPDIILLGNPCLFMVDQMVVALNNVDVLFDLSCGEIAKNGTNQQASSDRMSRLIRHLLEQRSFYPLFPPNPNVPIDDTHAAALRLPLAPDLLVLPSQLRYFARSVDDVLALNPGSATQAGSRPGTFARLSVQPLTLAGLDPLQVPHIPSLLAERTRVDIVQL